MFGILIMTCRYYHLKMKVMAKLNNPTHRSMSMAHIFLKIQVLVLLDAPGTMFIVKSFPSALVKTTRFSQTMLH